MSHVELAHTAATSIMTMLRADTTLRSLLTGAVTPRWSIYDQVPANAAYPYIELGDTTEVPDDVFAKQGTNATILLYVWSDYQGDKQARDIIARITTLLDRANLTVSPYTLEYCVREFATVQVQSDGIRRLGIVRFRIQAREA